MGIPFIHCTQLKISLKGNIVVKNNRCLFFILFDWLLRWKNKSQNLIERKILTISSGLKPKNNEDQYVQFPLVTSAVTTK